MIFTIYSEVHAGDGPPFEGAFVLRREPYTQYAGWSTGPYGDMYPLPVDWHTVGTNHRNEAIPGSINPELVPARDMEKVVWAVEINSLDELLALAARLDDDLVVSGDRELKFYDYETWR